MVEPDEPALVEFEAVVESASEPWAVWLLEAVPAVCAALSRADANSEMLTCPSPLVSSAENSPVSWLELLLEDDVEPPVSAFSNSDRLSCQSPLVSACETRLEASCWLISLTVESPVWLEVSAFNVSELKRLAAWWSATGCVVMDEALLCEPAEFVDWAEFAESVEVVSFDAKDARSCCNSRLVPPPAPVLDTDMESSNLIDTPLTGAIDLQDARITLSPTR